MGLKYYWAVIKHLMRLQGGEWVGVGKISFMDANTKKHFLSVCNFSLLK